MSIRGNTCSIHDWRLVMETKSMKFYKHCNNCDTIKQASMRNKLCFHCLHGNMMEVAYCYGGMGVKPCNHKFNKRHLVFECNNSDCRKSVNEEVELA